MEKTSRKANRWIATAAEEIRQIQGRWGFKSNRSFSAFLKVNPRTLSKLSHLDGTLTLESILKIFNRLYCLRCLVFSGKTMEEEGQRLKDAMFRIVRSVEVLPDDLADNVREGLESQM